MWTALFEAITAGFSFFGGMFRRSPAAPPPPADPIDAAAAREGTAAGAAANDASHRAGPKLDATNASPPK